MILRRLSSIAVPLFSIRIEVVQIPSSVCFLSHPAKNRMPGNSHSAQQSKAHNTESHTHSGPSSSDYRFSLSLFSHLSIFLPLIIYSLFTLCCVCVGSDANEGRSAHVYPSSCQRGHLYQLFHATRVEGASGSRRPLRWNIPRCFHQPRWGRNQ